MSARWYGTALGLLLGCASSVGTRPDPTPEPTEASEASAVPEQRAVPAPPSEDEPQGTIPVWVDGEQRGMVTREQAEARGLTILDLGDEWTPPIFHDDPSLGPQGRHPYRAELIRLANELAENGRPRRNNDFEGRYLELFGIFPTFHVLQQRLADDERHACHDAVDDAPILAIERALRPGADLPAQRRRANAIARLRSRLEEQARRRRLESIDELAGNRRWGGELRRLRELEAAVAGIRAVQAHLRCEGYLSPRAQDGVLDAWSGRALRFWQSRHMIIALASQLDEATRTTLTMDSRELDYISTLRSLRERVAMASGRIEDGSASNSWGTVMGRRLDYDDEFRWVSRLDPLPNGAPDLLSQATEAAARALGWTDPAATRAWLDAHASQRQPHRFVAVELPPPPPYHSDHMDIRVEIDRGDVWYTFPYTEDGRPRGFPVARRPTFVIYARHEGVEIPLVRWNTTIGSWQPEINPQDGTVGMRYKESDVGPRVWRDLISSPAWLPPPGTPDDELLVRRNGRWLPNRSITGPGYDSAYGLAMVIHHLVRNDGVSESDWVDRGIRSHGSVSYRSILRGYSHGCHRLFNHLAVRMTSFVLRHRRHVVRGRIPALFRRELQPEPDAESGELPPRVTLEIDTRGFLFELTPPVPVNVLEGRVRGRPTRAPVGFFPLPEQLQEQARQALAADPSTGAATGPAPAAPASPAPATPAPAPPAN